MARSEVARKDAKRPRRAHSIVWLDLGDLGAFLHADDPMKTWQDHGLGLLRTIMHENGVVTDLVSTRRCRSWEQVQRELAGYDVCLMNVRSSSFADARHAAGLFKQVNPEGVVIVGGMHASVALGDMEAVEAFDHICRGPGEGVIVDLAKHPAAFPRVVDGIGAKSMAEWPRIDRTLWPKPRVGLLRRILGRSVWPLEADPGIGWGESPVASVLTSRVCPWHCAFCNENSYISKIGRRSVDAVIEELNVLDRRYGIRSVVIHDSMFFQNPKWLEEWLAKYPTRANAAWPYWAAARADTVRRWPELFEALVRETNWHTVSIGFESGSERVLRLLNKECTAEDNYFAIDLLNRVGDDMERRGEAAPQFFSNIMLGIPGETHEDAFDTMAMARYTKRLIFSLAFYAPYPGSALGYQLIAEGKSLMSKENYTRSPGDEKVVGVDYGFYRDLLNGKYDGEVDARLAQVRSSREVARRRGDSSVMSLPAFRPPHALYLFDMKDGKKKLGYGESPEDALEVLSMRLTDAEMGEIVRDEWVKVDQREMQLVVPSLGASAHLADTA